MYFRGTARDNPWNRNVCIIAISVCDEQDVWIGPPSLCTLSIVFFLSMPLNWPRTSIAEWMRGCRRPFPRNTCRDRSEVFVRRLT